jgi:hypothetical protein
VKCEGSSDRFFFLVPEGCRAQLEFFQENSFQPSWFTALKSAYDRKANTTAKTEKKQDRKLSAVASIENAKNSGVSTRSSKKQSVDAGASSSSHSDTSASSASSSDTREDNVSGCIVMDPVVFLCAGKFLLHKEREISSKIKWMVMKDTKLDVNISKFKNENGWSEQFCENVKMWLQGCFPRVKMFYGLKMEMTRSNDEVTRNNLQELISKFEKCDGDGVCVSCQMLPQNQTQSDLQILFRRNGKRIADVIFEVGLVEAGWTGGRGKEHQSSKNVKHWWSKGFGKVGVPVFSIELYVVKKDTKNSVGQVIGVAITAFVKNKEDEKQHRVELFFDNKVEDVKSILRKVFEACMSEHCSGWERFGKNVAKFEGTMLKSYKQRDGMDEGEKRSPFLSKKLIDNAELDSQKTVLTYPEIKGACGDFSTKSVILSFLETIQGLHKDGVIMGDIRRRNWITCEGKKIGKLIDFDYSCCTQEFMDEVPDLLKNRYYPSSWNVQIDDGVRHKDALPNQRMQKIHDVYSACYGILACFDNDTFTTKNQQLKFGLLAVADACLKEDVKSEEVLDLLIKFVDQLDELKDEGSLIPI